MSERASESGSHVQTLLVDMPVEDCEELLGRSPIGRLGVIVDGRPEIFPMNHVFDPHTRSVAFPTTAGTKLDAALNWPWAAYEVDGIDDEGRGWSVLVVGRAEEITDPVDIERLESHRHVLWQSGESARWLRIVPNRVSGRRISARPT